MPSKVVSSGGSSVFVRTADSSGCIIPHTASTRIATLRVCDNDVIVDREFAERQTKAPAQIKNRNNASVHVDDTEHDIGRIGTRRDFHGANRALHDGSGRSEEHSLNSSHANISYA